MEPDTGFLPGPAYLPSPRERQGTGIGHSRGLPSTICDFCDICYFSKKRSINRLKHLLHSFGTNTAKT